MDVEKGTQSRPTEAPRLVLICQSDGQLDKGFILCDGVRITGSSSVLECILLLIATYYTFDLDYPAVYAQLLGFLQQMVLLDPYTGKKSTNFIKMVKKCMPE